ncbi:hypothetical protein RJO15_00900 [Herbaspirillum huttiense F1]|uniref:Transmembrane protein n=1 Tax=Herbaspirillum huttiense subsp. lycopersici TaxID=3074428 RepID=A0ABU2ESJ5_9BURK|nr:MULTISPECIES: hypothetical protein [Herbaspirillum]MBP1316406.1 membrane protein implicated in regulation of membrane protease activity [Herbaspirillum sp. 1130]MDR6739749.1 membrane protein implicated in regulation of membrane protease activity [Herbaspirillum sp. 1173]MDR9850733.1 hypothetical protein [Herbaspirillum huttiense SE1]MDT0354318.1 hypothetical protein [Herbaspirillum huttiense F1]
MKNPSLASGSALAILTIGLAILVLLDHLEWETMLILVLPLFCAAVAAVLFGRRLSRPRTYFVSTVVASYACYFVLDSSLGIFSIPEPRDGQHYRIVGEPGVLVLGTFSIWPFCLFLMVVIFLAYLIFRVFYRRAVQK